MKTEKDILAYMAEYRKNNAEKIKKIKKKWRDNNREKVNEYSRKYRKINKRVRKKYDNNEKILKLEKIAGRSKPEICEICGRKGIICFDHCHKTGKFRGWICSNCNKSLGLMEDNTQYLQLSINYLNNNK